MDSFGGLTEGNPKKWGMRIYRHVKKPEAYVWKMDCERRSNEEQKMGVRGKFESPKN